MVDNKSDYIYTTYIILKNGTRLYAKQFGLKAFRFKKRK